MAQSRKRTAILLLTLFSLWFLQLPALFPLSPNADNPADHVIADPALPQSAAAVESVWWNGSWNYRKIIDINATSRTRVDSLIEVWVNFTAVLVTELSVTGEVFDFNSIRVIETDVSTGALIVHNASAVEFETSKYEVPYSTWKHHQYSATTNAMVKISWVLHGTTAANANRTYGIYFDTVTNGLKPAPNYWAGSYETRTGQDEGLANNAYIANTLYTIKSSNLTVFITGDVAPARPRHQRLPARLWYKTGSTYRYDQTIIDETTLTAGGTRQEISAAVTYTENKIFFPNAGGGSGFNMNLTYEIFENSIFTKVTCSFVSTGHSAGLTVIFAGDRDGQNWHVDGDGHSFQGSLATMGPYLTNKWTAGWINTRTDLLGYVMYPYQTFTTGNYDNLDLRGEITGLTESGKYDEFSFYMVTCPKGSPNQWTPVEELWQDLINAPKSYSFMKAEKRRAAIYVTVIDHDGFPVPGAAVYLNASADWSAWNDTATTTDLGTCSFINKQQGDYNFTVNLTAPFQNLTLQTNASVRVSCDLVNNYITVNSSAYRVTFNVKDKDNLPLPNSVWVSINQSTGTYLNNITIDASGNGVFRWANNSDYNYTLYYRDTPYNGNVPIEVDWGTITWSSHSQGMSEVRTISAEMARVNFTIVDDQAAPVIGATVRVYNQSDAGPIGGVLVDLAPTDSSGKTSFYWRTKAGNENYSLVLLLASAPKQINSTDGGAPWVGYQNFTTTQSIAKDIIVNVDTSKYRGVLGAVNNEFMNVYWNTSLAIQAIYKHDPNEGVFTPADTSTMTYTVKNNLQQVLAGPLSMTKISQPGRWQAAIDMETLGMVAGSTYSVTIEATEPGFSPITPLTYFVNVLAIPTALSAERTSFDSRWGDMNSTNLQMDVRMPESVNREYVVLNSSQWVSDDFTLFTPYVENKWNLTRIEFDFSNYNPSGGLFGFRVRDQKDEILSFVENTTVSQPSLALTLTGSWNHENLVFKIETYGLTFPPAYYFTTKSYYQRTAVVVNQTITNVAIPAGGNANVSINTPGNGWKVQGMNLTLLDLSASLPTLMNFTWYDGSYGVITATSQSFPNLNWFLDPESKYIRIQFNSSDTVSFNLSLSIAFEQVTDRHPYTETDVVTGQYVVTGASPNPYLVNLENSASRVWSITQYRLSFTGFRNDTGHLVVPSECDVRLTYNGISYVVADGEEAGRFDFIITAPVASPMLAFSLSHTGSQQTYNLTILRSSQFLNVLGLDDVAIGYYLFSNNSVTGTAAPAPSLGGGNYSFTFDTSRALVGTQIVKVSGTRANFATASVDLTFAIVQIYTRINGTTFFNRNRNIYKTETLLIYLNYSDVYNLVGGNAQGIGGATATFEVGFYSLSDPNADTPLSTDAGTLVDQGNGLYLLDYSTAYLQEGIYKFAFYVYTASGVYEPRSSTVNLRIDLIPSTATAQVDVVQSKTQRQPATFSFKLTDGRATHAGQVFPQSLTTSSVVFTSAATFNMSYLSWANDTSGTYNLTADTRKVTPGTYTLRVTFGRVNYTSVAQDITLTVARYEPSVTVPASVLSVTEGDNAVVQIEVSDALLGMQFDSILITWTIDGTTLTGTIDQVSADGKYTIAFPTADLPPNANYKMTIAVSVTTGGVTYTIVTTKEVNMRVEFVQILGIPRPYFWGIMIGVIALVAVLAVYRSVKYARIPVFVRQVRATRVTIQKGKPVERATIAETRGASIARALESRYAALGMIAEEKFAPKGQAEAGAAGSRNPEEEVGA